MTKRSRQLSISPIGLNDKRHSLRKCCFPNDQYISYRGSEDKSGVLKELLFVQVLMFKYSDSMMYSSAISCAVVNIFRRLGIRE